MRVNVDSITGHELFSPTATRENSNFMTKRKEANRTMATSFANKCLRVLATNQ